MTNHPHVGSSLDELLQDDGLLEHAKAVAVSRVIAALPHERQQQIEARVAELAALQQASQILDDQLTAHDVDTEAVVAEFKQARKG